jgi:hypothetical protein
MRWVALLVAMGVAALGWRNPVDAIVRGKWVRYMDTRSGEATATMCLPAATPAEVPSHRAELPERVRALHAAGATVVAIDLDLSTPHPSDADLRAAAGLGPTLFTRHGDNPPFVEPSARREMVTTWFVPMVLGAAVPEAPAQPLALAALALHARATPSAAEGGAVTVGPLTVAADAHTYQFHPYEVPFIHWTESETWKTAAGRIVFVGACKADRNLTRYGRQPAPVAHAELVETWRDARHPVQGPVLLDIALAAATFGLAWVAGSKSRWLGPAVVGAGAFGASMGVALTDLWIGVSGLVVSAIGAALTRR